MSRLAERFRLLRRRGEKALLCYLTAGDPDLATTAELCRAAADAGADGLEIGLPFSDPLADGPVIQEASVRALAAGTGPRQVFELVSRVRAELELPLVLLTYFNPIYRWGVARFLGEAADAGLDGLVVADLPLEEGAEAREQARRQGIDPIAFIAPTSTAERLQATAREASGFIYCVSVTGVTGAREAVSSRVEDLVRRAREYTDVPLAVGFGISSPAQVRQVARYADAAIVGSALVRLAAETGPGERSRRIAAFVRELKDATRY